MKNSPDPTAEIEQRRVPSDTERLLESKLRDALGTLVRVCQHMGAMFVEKGVPLPELKDGERDLSISAARLPVEQLFREQTRVLESAAGEIYDLKKSVASLSDENARLSKDYGNLLLEANQFESELASLKSTQLTGIDAAYLLETLETAGVRPSENPALFEKLFRLRSLSSQEPDKT